MKILHKFKAWNKRMDDKICAWRFKNKKNCLIDAFVTMFIALVIYLALRPYLPSQDKEEMMANIVVYNFLTIFVFYPFNTFVCYKYNLWRREKYLKKKALLGEESNGRY